MSTPAFDLGDDPQAATPTSEQQAQVRAALGLSGPPIEFDTDADKLLADDLVIGTVAIITEEANRVEQLVLSAASVQESWVVLKNTVYLYVNNTSGGEVVVNGETVPDGENIGVGWVDPLDIPYDGFGRVIKEIVIRDSDDTAIMQFIPATSDFYTTAEAMSPLIIPFATYSRGAVTIKF